MRKYFTLLAIAFFMMFPLHSQAYDEYSALDENQNIVIGTDEDVQVFHTIADGTFNGKVTAGNITGGTFNGEVIIQGNVEVSGGTFNGNVYTSEEVKISGGTFNKQVNATFGNITGGDFKGIVLLECGSITGGTFNRLQAIGVSSSVDCTVENCVITGMFEIPETPYNGTRKVRVKNVALQNVTHVSVIGMDEACYKDAFSNETDGKIEVMMSSSPARYLKIQYLRQGLLDQLTVAFDANGGTGQMESYWNYVYGSIQLPKCTFTKAGTEFVEWNTKAGGDGVARKENQFIYTGAEHKKGDVFTVYAQWKDGSTGQTDNTGKGEDAGKTDDTGKGEDAGKTGDTGKGDDAGKTDDTGKTDTSGQQESKALKKGDKVTLASGTYRITGVSKKQITAEYYSAPANKTKITIVKSFKKDGKTVKVTSVRANAMSGNKKATNVTVPNTVTKIGAKAFYNMKAAKVITINANKNLKVGAGAFQKMKKGSVIKIKGLKKADKTKVTKVVKKQITAKNTSVK